MDDNSNNWNNTQNRYDQLPVDVETINYAIKNLNDISSPHLSPNKQEYK